jgi:hypothetical protein
MATKVVRRGWLGLALLCALAWTSLPGCGGVRRVSVAGTVTLDGVPLDGGVLVFSPDPAKGNASQISCNGPVREGRYEMQTIGITRADSGSGVPLGWYKVTLRTPHVGGKKQPQAAIEVNEKYQSVEKTPLSVEVKDNPEPGAYDFKLTK